MSERKILAKFQSACRQCGGGINAGDEAWYLKTEKRGFKMRHVVCMRASTDPLPTDLAVAKQQVNAILNPPTIERADSMTIQLNSLTKEQLIEVHRHVFGNVGDSARTTKSEYVDALQAQAVDHYDTVNAAILSITGSVLNAAMPVVDVPIFPAVHKGKGNGNGGGDAAANSAQALVDLIRSVAGGAVDVDTVRNIVTEEIAKIPAAAEIVHQIIVTPTERIAIDEHVHPVFEEVLQMVSTGENVLLVGPAGCGKSFLAEQVARYMKRKFGALHCTAGASESQLTGWLLPTGDGGKFEYVAAQFATLYGEGNSLFMLDEIDASDPNFLLVANGALSNGHLMVPQRFENPVIKRGENVSIMAAANTYGYGADQVYAGRNPLDGSTLDRFYKIPMGYDTALEQKQAGNSEILHFVWALREKVVEHKIRRVVSTRMIQQATAAVKAGRAWAEVKARLLSGWTRDELAKVGAA